MVQRTSTGPTRALGVLVAVATAVGLTTAGVAAAAPHSPAPAPPAAARPAPGAPATPAPGPAAPVPDAHTPPTHPEADHMGSTIREHEASPPPGITPHAATAQVRGMDVSAYQGNVDWRTAYGNGARFAYMKASEATTYTNPYFAQQYNGSAGAGIIRGAYHFADPDTSSGATQATYFVQHGGGWSADGRTLPPMLDIEYNPYGSNICYGLNPAQMSGWIADFSNTVQRLTGRYPTIYTTTNWWNTCTGSNSHFGANPLFIARYASSVGPLPPSWSVYTMWQNSDSGVFPGDQDVFNGAYPQLQSFAGLPPAAAPAPAPAPSTPAVAAKYASLGGPSSYLGARVGGEYAVAGGVGQNYANGAIFSSPATGAHAMLGTILGRYRALGGPASALGFPTSDELVAADQRGRFQAFARAASIYWDPAKNAAYVLGGAARDKYVALGGPVGLLGYPTADTAPTPDGVGTHSHFAGLGGAIYTSPATGAHEVHGAIATRWAALGWERSGLGYPTSDELPATDNRGRMQNFVGGTLVWNPASNRVVSLDAPAAATWARMGGAAGLFGYPNADTASTPDGLGRHSHFTGTNGAVYTGPASGTHEVHGDIAARWAALGWERSYLGYPTSDETAVPGGRRNTFQHGTLTWNAATRAVG